MQTACRDRTAKASAANIAEHARRRKAQGIPEPDRLLAEHRRGASFTALAAKYNTNRNQIAGLIFRARKRQTARSGAGASR